jgi:hypothetical protein
MFGITIVFGVPMLIAGTMISPEGLHFWGLVSYAGIMFVNQRGSGTRDQRPIETHTGG